MHRRSKYAQPNRIALKLCLQREIILLTRMKAFVVIRWLQLALLGVIAGTVFLRLDTSSVSAANSMLGVLYYSLIMMYVGRLSGRFFDKARVCCRVYPAGPADGTHLGDILASLLLLHQYIHVHTGCLRACRSFPPPSTACRWSLGNATMAFTRPGYTSFPYLSSSFHWGCWTASCGRLSFTFWSA